MSRKTALTALALGMLVFLLSACAPVEFSPDNKRILFCWSSDGKSNRLYTMNTDGTHLAALPGGDGGLLSRWSPDGRAILFGDTGSALKAFDVAKNRSQVIDSNAGLAFAWREDSRQFAALHRTMDNRLELRRYRWPEKTVVSRVKLPADLDTAGFKQMMWLPGRQEVACLAERPDRSTQLILVSEAGVREPVLSRGAVGIGLSANGKALLWACPSADLTKNLMTLYQYDPITDRAAALPFPAHLAPLNTDASHAIERIEEAAFSPDGVWIALVVEQPVGAIDRTPFQLSDAVYVVRTDGTGAHLVRQASDVTSGDSVSMKQELIPSWSHDGKRLAVLQWGTEKTSISLYNADGSGETSLPLPGRVEEALLQRVQTYLARHYSRFASPPAPDGRAVLNH